MADREKVVDHLNDCLEASRRENTWVFARKDIVEDAIALLKECKAQKFFVDENGKITPLPIVFPNCPLEKYEAVKPRISSVEQRCGNCNKVIEMDGWIACPWCGKPILWESR